MYEYRLHKYTLYLYSVISGTTMKMLMSKLES